MIEGKLPPDLLEKLVLRVMPTSDPRVLVGPRLGEDAAVIDMGDRVIVVHSDPITGAVERIGWYAIHIACNDVAATGARPRWVLPVVLVPKGRIDLVAEIASDIACAAVELGVAVVGGHTEATGWLDRPIVSVTAVGEAPRNGYVTSSGARPGDVIIATKAVALEGTSILARDYRERLADKVPEDALERAAGFIREISVVRDAMLAVETGGVTALHDPTEGGFLGGVYEMAVASGVGARVYEDKVPVRKETRLICRAMGVDPLKLISSGMLLIAVSRDKAERVVDTLRAAGIEATVVGEFNDTGVVELVRRDRSIETVRELPMDELWKISGKEL